jgi:hypothetical protein
MATRRVVPTPDVLEIEFHQIPPSEYVLLYRLLRSVLATTINCRQRLSFCYQMTPLRREVICPPKHNYFSAQHADLVHYSATIIRAFPALTGQRVVLTRELICHTRGDRLAVVPLI